jgi:O-6-methylguanine DNA methyltransferase
MRNQRSIKVNNLNLHIVLDDKYIYGIHWKKQAVKIHPLSRAQSKLLSDVQIELKGYFKKEIVKFKTPIKLEGTEFQMKVWNELSKIPYAKLVSYKDLAIKIGSPSASRAVGTANSKNPISIIVPCHRVIQSSGEYGGYAGGELTKKYLIDSELGIS